MTSKQNPIHNQSQVVDSVTGAMKHRLNRRDLLKGAAVTSAAVVASTMMSKVEAVTAAGKPAAPAQWTLVTVPHASGTSAAINPDAPMIPAGYVATTLVKWGDPIVEGAPAFDPENQSAQAQEQQFGYNNDFVGFMPLPDYASGDSKNGLLVVNHEYTNPELMFDGYNLEEPEPTKEQVDVELAAHGMSVVEIKQDNKGQWGVVSGPMNRRITAMTPMLLTGPAAGSDWLKTSEDSTGTTVNGTLNNCAGGKTPWGTVLSGEENFHQYFANRGAMTDADLQAVHKRYGVPEEASELKWETFYDRFDTTKEPNEPFRFGWVVEIDPYDPQSTPLKRTALGRFKHEAATVAPVEDGQPVTLYSGDDERFEYVYKFVSQGAYNATDRAANMTLLDEGTLYVAKFNDDGSGEWMPLVYGEGPLTEENGFTSQADVLVKTRLAADLLEATTMDRPEDIETNPVNNKVYIALTKNDKRLKTGDAAAKSTPEKTIPENQEVNAANPRPKNYDGHIIELTEDGDDFASTSFTWEILLLCGHPSDSTTDFAGYDKTQVSPISSPDNICFDAEGNLWIVTDGQPTALGVADGCFKCPVEGPERGHVMQFFSSVPGSEVCGPEFTPDNTSLFLAIQHPGEGGNFSRPISYWPDYKAPTRPSVLVVQAEDAIRRVGSF